jgi:hypothetical protein
MITWSTSAGAGWVAALRHKVFDYAVKYGVIVEALAGKKDEIINGMWGFIGKKFSNNVAFIGVKGCCVLFSWV